MAIYSPPFGVDGQIGGLNFVFTPNPADGYDNPNHAPGTKRTATDASEYIYVKAAATINQGDTVQIDRNGNAVPITQAIAAAGIGRIGICQVSGGIPVGSYCWVAIEGDDLVANLATGTAAGSALYTTAVPGVLSSTATSQTQIFGVTANVANSSGAVALTSVTAGRLRLAN